MKKKFNLKLALIFLTYCTISLLIGCNSTPRHAHHHDLVLNNPLPNTEARYVLVQEATTQLGKPYKISGNSPREGFDCSGLVFYTYLKVGRLLPRKAEDQYLSAHKVYEVNKGDLVFFSTDSKGRHIDHVGIYLGNKQFIHAPGKGRDVVIANLAETYWQQRYKGAGNYLD